MKNKLSKQLNCYMLFLFIFVSRIAEAETPSKVNTLRITEDKNAAHVMFDLSQPVKWRIFSLENPKRIIIDFEKTRLAFNLKHAYFPKKRIVSLRQGYPKPGMLRIVLDVNEGVSYSVVTKQPSKEVKIDLLSPVKTSLNKAAVNKVALKINDDNIVVKTTVKTILNTKIFYRTKPMVVVIDAGHGGKDPGAIGQYGTREKDVVLSIARMLANLVNEQPKMRAVLTRDGDYFISLRKRLEITRRSKADLFIAIHADSYFNNRASGASVYSLSNHGASSVAARWLAQRENHSELGGVDLAGLEDQSVILRSVLLDLAQTATNQASLRCGRGLLDALSDVTRLHYARVEQAPFMVLKSPDIPSILVETGFISNVKEEYRLRDKSHQYKVALALFEGVHDFQQKYLVKEV